MIFVSATPVQIVEILQLSVAPVVLISGVGLILLSQTNKMTHVINRIRYLNDMSGKDQQRKAQVLMLYRRAGILRMSVIFSILSLFFDALLIPGIFLTQLLNTGSSAIIIICFILSIVFLIAALFFYLLDVNHNLRALYIEVHRKRAPQH